ncbi:MAG: hypothetical protein ABIJ28_01165 [Patescibacteria group bacterium]
MKKIYFLLFAMVLTFSFTTIASAEDYFLPPAVEMQSFESTWQISEFGGVYECSLRLENNTDRKQKVIVWISGLTYFSSTASYPYIYPMGSTKVVLRPHEVKYLKFAVNILSDKPDGFHQVIIQVAPKKNPILLYDIIWLGFWKGPVPAPPDGGEKG